MNTFFTSDTHFSHANIIRFCNRPFADVEEMDRALIRNWNATVQPDDVVYHLGDVALGPIAHSLPLVGQLNGHKTLVVGNHDRTFQQSGARLVKWEAEYRKVFQSIADSMIVTTPALDLRLSHFPYDGDSHDEDRYGAARPHDDGMTLIHGHTHSATKVTRSALGSVQVHVGVDAWDYRPAPLDEVLALVNECHHGEREGECAACAACAACSGECITCPYVRPKETP